MSELGYLRSQNREIIPLTSKIITIGKDPGCDIVISVHHLTPIILTEHISTPESLSDTLASLSNPPTTLT